ncbi:sulfurtransferase [Cognatiluteimonas profundi]|uniref:sulfurtransferase n=1 Tax=Cognatiluteimonas profundi TaxID=2594501 RepID=UPI00131CCF39|nr:sulfurtransferase [Lysobacter profundi]
MILNIAAYRFVAIDDPHALAERACAWALADDLRGTVLLAAEGINLFLAGSEAGVQRFLGELCTDPRMVGLPVKYSWSQAQPFARLKVKVKREIIAFRRDDASPLSGRAPTVDAPTLARWIASGVDDSGRRLVLLDTRNREEVAFGTFAGAVALPIDNFTDLPHAIEPHRADWKDATVVSFCTGGIRCEKAALWMRGTGMDNVAQLDGGILGYFENAGGVGFEGRCFVFDARVAVDPQLKPLVDGPQPQPAT